MEWEVQLQVIELIVNGQVRSFDEARNLEELLDTLHLAGKRLAVERNGEIVPHSRYAQTSLQSGDRLEIVMAVGGG
jgi:sulfur carrier protein